MLDYEYEYRADANGEAHFYLAQYKSNRMKDWRYIRGDTDYFEVFQEVEQFKKRSVDNKYKIRILKVDCSIVT